MPLNNSAYYKARPEKWILKIPQNYKCNTFVFASIFSWAELKNLRLFLCTQKAYFSQILFTNLSKFVLVSTSPLPRQSIHLTGEAYQDDD